VGASLDCEVQSKLRQPLLSHVFGHGDGSSGGRKCGAGKGKMTDLTRENFENDGDDNDKIDKRARGYAQ
jgi:hypothetical protein